MKVVFHIDELENGQKQGKRKNLIKLLQKRRLSYL